MLELPIHILRKPFEIKSSTRNCFSRPLVFFISNKKDRCKDLICIVIVNFSASELVYIESYSESNRNELNDHPYLARMAGHASPHSVVPGPDPSTFLVFFETCGAFLRIDTATSKMQILTERNVPGLREVSNVTQVGTTLYTDSDSHEWFYFPVLSDDGNSPRCHVFRTKVDLSEAHKIAVMSGDNILMPHTTRRHKDLLLNSGFGWTLFQQNKTGKLSETSSTEGLWEILGNIYTEYCETKEFPCTQEGFLWMLETATRPPSNSKDMSSDNLYPKFRRFFVERYGNFEEICRQRHISLVQEGRFNTVSLESGKVETHSTRVANCAHFEIDTESDTVYVSNHNFIRFPETTFFGPGSLEKYRFSDNKFVFDKEFSDPKAYRLTSHRLFKFDNKQYVVTIGHPNRLFVIDAESMEVVHFEDIGRPIVSLHSDLKKYLNESFLSSNEDAIVPIEVGSNGMLLLIGQKTIYFYDFGKRKIVDTLAFLPSDHHILYSVHCQYI